MPNSWKEFKKKVIEMCVKNTFRALQNVFTYKCIKTKEQKFLMLEALKNRSKWRKRLH
jgi:hypothetical protein